MRETREWDSSRALFGGPGASHDRDWVDLRRHTSLLRRYWGDLRRHTSSLGRCAARRSAATPALLASLAPRLARNSPQYRPQVVWVAIDPQCQPRLVWLAT